MSSIVSRILEVVFKVLCFLRPARLDFSAKRPKVVVKDDLASIELEATINCGCFRWWGWRKTITVTLPRDLKLGPFLVNSTNLTKEGASHELRDIDVSLSIDDLISGLGKKWGKNDTIQVQVVVPCRGSGMLEFPLGPDGERTITVDGYTTRFVVRQAVAYRNVELRQVTWRRSVDAFIPLRSISVVKGGQQVPHLRADYLRAATRVVGIDNVAITADGTLANPPEATSYRSEANELSIPLAFSNADEEYEIVFHSGNRGGS